MSLNQLFSSSLCFSLFKLHPDIFSVKWKYAPTKLIVFFLQKMSFVRLLFCTEYWSCMQWLCVGEVILSAAGMLNYRLLSWEHWRSSHDYGHNVNVARVAFMKKCCVQGTYMACIHTCTHIHAHTHMRARTHARAHTHTHTHTAVCYNYMLYYYCI